MTTPLPLAVTIGDPAGVGPEIVAHILAREAELGLPPLRVVGEPGPSVRPGQPDRASAQCALDGLGQAVAMVRSGECSALVTGPVAKSAIALIDPNFIGQTEFLADACGLPREDAVMMLAGPSLKTVPMTVHCALADVPARLSQHLICLLYTSPSPRDS